MCTTSVTLAVRVATGGLAALAYLAAVTSDVRAQERAPTSAPLEIPVGNSPRSALADSRRVREAFGRLYATDSARWLWSVAGRPTFQASEIVAILERAAEKGLRPSDYDAAAQRTGLAKLAGGSATATELKELDFALSRAVLRLLDHLHTGRVHPGAVGFDIPDSHDALDLAALTVAVSQSSDVATAIAAAEPPYAGYARLVRALARHRQLATDTGIRPPPRLRTTLRPGDRYADAPSLRRLLTAFGDLPADAPVAVDSAGVETYGGALVDGVVAFQRRHGLEPDGVIGAATMTQLRLPATERVRQIELTLERWRWLPDRPPSRYIVVNVPAFRLSLFEDDPTAQRPVLTMNVIVGQAHGRHHTPVFTKVMREVVFRPYWDVPPNIARRELLPIIRRNPSYLVREALEIVRGGDEDATIYPPTAANLDRVAAGTLRLRQRPGPSNALGLVKFLFPNRYNVYMHGTPAQELFAQSRRDFSHGCIRVEDPTALAEAVLRGQAPWDRAAVEAAMTGTGTRRIPIARPVAVYVLYGTAVVNDTGVPMFLPDIYGHDAALARALRLMPASGAGS